MPLRTTSGAFRHACWSARLFAPPESRACTEKEQSFEAVVQEYRRPLIGFLFRMVHDEVVAEELVEETFLRLHRSRDRFDGPDKVTTWLYRMAASLAINHGESMRAERAKVAGSAPAVSQQQPTVAQERVLAIRRHVDGLPERQQCLCTSTRASITGKLPKFWGLANPQPSCCCLKRTRRFAGSWANLYERHHRHQALDRGVGGARFEDQ
jgi:RNA polymerase sigma factor (sigma-70 family)